MKQASLQTWVGLQEREPATPQPHSHIVTGSEALTPEGQNIQVTMERVSTGGTRWHAQFKFPDPGVSTHINLNRLPSAPHKSLKWLGQVR